MAATFKVYLSCPTKRNISAATCRWIVDEIGRMPEGSVYFSPCVDPRPLDHCRNRMVSEFLGTNCTHLFTVDSDCLPQPGTIMKLLGFGLPFVAAPHECIVGGEPGVMVVDKVPGGGYKQHLPIAGLQKADAVGGSGLLVRRDVFEVIEPPWFRMVLDERTGLLRQGEDFYFCDRLFEAGFDVYADCDLIQRHDHG